MDKLYVAIDVGCIECGVGCEVIGSYWTVDEANMAADQRYKETNGWRDGGQSLPEIFEITMPESIQRP